MTFDLPGALEQAFVSHFGHPINSTYISSIVEYDKDFRSRAILFTLLLRISVKHDDEAIRKEASSRLDSYPDKAHIANDVEFVIKNSPMVSK